MNNWELKRVLSVTVDNVTANNVGVQYLKRRMLSWNCLVLKGEYVHMRCCAHILSSIVKDGLKEIKNSISKTWSVVKYVKSSPAQFARFKACVEQEEISYKGLIFLDVETIWNSTYLMLEASLKNSVVKLKISAVQLKNSAVQLKIVQFSFDVVQFIK